MKPQPEPTPNSMIIGHIYDKEGHMLGGAKVICNGKSTVALFDGSFRFEKLVSGKYRITASLGGFQSQSKTVSIKAGETITVDLSLNKAVGTAKIRGCVYDAETGKPIVSGGTVILILPVANKYASTNKDGCYEFANLAADTYEVWASVGGYEEVKAKIAVKRGETKNQDFYCPVKRVVEPPWG